MFDTLSSFSNQDEGGIIVFGLDEKLIVSAEIPAVDVAERPVYYVGVGRIKGSYVRVGDSDEPMSEYEIYSYEAFRKRIQDDM